MLIVIALMPIEIFSLAADLKRCIKIDEKVGLGDHLPHLRHKRVFLNYLLEKALLADDSRASDDITVLVAAIQKGSGEDVRHLSVQLPF